MTEKRKEARVDRANLQTMTLRAVEGKEGRKWDWAGQTSDHAADTTESLATLLGTLEQRLLVRRDALGRPG